MTDESQKLEPRPSGSGSLHDEPRPSGSGSTSSVRVERDGPVYTVIIDRADRRNAVDGPTARELTLAFRAFEADDAARVAVLYGEGGNFCAGADLKAMGSDTGNVADIEGDGPLGPTRLVLGKPVIAAVAGFAVAGGLELALWCDLRVAEESAVFGVFCRRWGVPLIDGGTVRLPRLIGHSRAMDMILPGRGVPAREALAFGLANRVVADGTARAEAENLARRIAAFPQTCMRGDRMSAIEQWDLPFDRATKNEFRHGAESLATDEIGQGLDAFRAGRGRGGAFEE
ncbi:crotonase/enoyl-CoA hydratase family protein [bacterium]|nr:crotonase/enoyl-CoA hydratase family protein [bacterium]